MSAQNWETIGIGFLFAAFLGFWAVFHIVQNERAGPLGKAIWCVCVLWIPYLGFLAWLFFGPRAERRRVR